MEYRKLIADRLTRLMRENKVSQERMAELLSEKGYSVKRATIGNWMKGNTSIPMEVAPMLCDIFKVTLYQLYSAAASTNLEVDTKTLNVEFKYDPEFAFNNLTNQYIAVLEDARKYKEDAEWADSKLKEFYDVYDRQLNKRQ